MAAGAGENMLPMFHSDSACISRGPAAVAYACEYVRKALLNLWRYTGGVTDQRTLHEESTTVGRGENMKPTFHSDSVRTIVIDPRLDEPKALDFNIVIRCVWY